MRRLMLSMIGAVSVLHGCTTVGLPSPELRDAIIRPGLTTVRLCAWLDDGVAARDAVELLALAWDPAEEQVGIAWQIVLLERHARPAYWYWGIRQAVNAIMLPPDCDRLMWFIGRHAGDVLYGLAGLASPLPLPEALGYVEDEDRTRGYVVARRATLPQVFLITPASALRHELYHMLGCEHWVVMGADCYQAIAKLRRLKSWVGYVPGWDPETKRAVRRKEVKPLDIPAVVDSGAVDRLSGE